VYWEGYRDNNKSSWTYTAPLTYPYYTTTANPITLGSTIKGNEIKNEI
jgi:hypothetical protein